ncbi:supervillin-like [Anthonomus grandis grandis]|uniref:supervillin-like n=1 Tax=Anthonomus grandis grandis TaxID=2921223 RepID=UPI00216694CB|nr:supervillin-like [Anthonomus grandis grandis]
MKLIKSAKMNINLKDLISPKYTEPTVFVNFYKITRPSATPQDSYTHTLLKTNNLTCWKIIKEQLMKVNDPSGIFFDQESYIIQWIFDLKLDNTILEELLVYHWRGRNAVKGFSPLPPDIEEHCPVERIVQWSEPALFFHGFPQGVFVFSGESSGFNDKQPHLLMARGELPEELHFYEVPCEKRALRSRAVFVLIHPGVEKFIIWRGKSVGLEHSNEFLKTLQNWQKGWQTFSVETVKEGSENEVFLNTLKGELSEYCPIELMHQFSPKLFYLNSIGGQFEATPVEYPLRAEGVVAPFPFLQNHLYSAIQPALFLLDNNTEVYLWEGKRSSTGCEEFEKEVILAKQLAEEYISEKARIMSQKIQFYHVYAKKEPLEFQNIFPVWN